MRKIHEKNQLDAAVSHATSAHHLFFASDDSAELDQFVSDLVEALIDEPTVVINAAETTDNGDFSRQVVSACLELLSSIDSDMSREPTNLFGYLEETMLAFRECGRRGFLIVNHIDAVVDRQATCEMEGAFRSAMQRYDDVVVVWTASRETILIINDAQRPFYLSFRNFGL